MCMWQPVTLWTWSSVSHYGHVAAWHMVGMWQPLTWEASHYGHEASCHMMGMWQPLTWGASHYGHEASYHMMGMRQPVTWWICGILSHDGHVATSHMRGMWHPVTWWACGSLSHEGHVAACHMMGMWQPVTWWACGSLSHAHHVATKSIKLYNPLTHIHLQMYVLWAHFASRSCFIHIDFLPRVFACRKSKLFYAMLRRWPVRWTQKCVCGNVWSREYHHGFSVQTNCISTYL
jgi:hypothetical protein